MKILLLIWYVLGWKAAFAQVLPWDSVRITLPEQIYSLSEVQKTVHGWIMLDPISSRLLAVNDMFEDAQITSVAKKGRPVVMKGFSCFPEVHLTFLHSGNLLCMDTKTGIHTETSGYISGNQPGNLYDKFQFISFRFNDTVDVFYPLTERISSQAFQTPTEKYRNLQMLRKPVGHIRMYRNTKGNWKTLSRTRMGRFPIEYTRPVLNHMEYIHLCPNGDTTAFWVGYAGSPEIQCYSQTGELINQWRIPADSMEADDTLRYISSPVDFEAQRMQYSLESGRYLQLYYHGASQSLFRVYSTGVQDTCPPGVSLHERSDVQASLWERKKWYLQVIHVQDQSMYKRTEIRLPHEYYIIGSNADNIMFTDFRIKDHQMNVYLLPIDIVLK